MAITIKMKHKKKRTENVLHHIRRSMAKPLVMNSLKKYGEDGVRALSASTPIESGTTASNWFYRIEENDGQGYSLHWWNTNIRKNVNIAVILQLGHGTGTGGWVEGRDYINPAIQPVFDELARSCWEEVIKSL